MRVKTDTVQLVKDLVRINTENPLTVEKECGDYVYNWLNKLGNVEVSYEEVSEGRPNIIAKYKGVSREKPIVLIAHMDTVPAGEGWDMDPFGGDIIDGKMYGRGSCDMKSGLAVAMKVMEKVSEEKLTLNRDFYVCVTVDEEGPEMAGAVDLVKKARLPDDAMIIATEPTSNHIAPAHKGTVWFDVEAAGKSAHAGYAHLGLDAIHAVSAVIMSIKSQIDALPYNHETLGKTAVTVGKIAGGEKTNMVPRSCRAELDFRLVPPMTVGNIQEFLEEAVKEGEKLVPGVSVTFKQKGLARPPLETPLDSYFCRELAQAYLTVTGEDVQYEGFPAYTDAGIISLLSPSTEAMVFGPGSLTNAHIVNEYVELSEIDICEKVLFQLVKTI
ncbi:M20 family metallopeptidase [Bacillus sp. KH172YL63]|uniref:M20 family metallopeptidase n=1 Tax=Bacillus sp. KH172YL63 TaxID=2709784 RepID=UPI0013E45EEA|nr:M20 family metallopeptidase [Bacillus sp. KH172YL63]BCB02586.1 succinyl-diaminopimelate desuccinylase [Bacillus sp. KH172YL63]